MPLTIYLRDQNEDVVKAFNSFFGRNARVDIALGDVLSLDPSVIVMPTNSFGILDSGLAAVLNKKSDGKLEPRVRKLIADKYAGELPVGWADIITSGLDSPKSLIIAPTMRVPIRMTSANTNSYLATRAALRVLAGQMRQEREEFGETKIEERKVYPNRHRLRIYPYPLPFTIYHLPLTPRSPCLERSFNLDTKFRIVSSYKVHTFIS